MLLANFNGKEHLRHRAVSLRQHGFLVVWYTRVTDGRTGDSSALSIYAMLSRAKNANCDCVTWLADRCNLPCSQMIQLFKDAGQFVSWAMSATEAKSLAVVVAECNFIELLQKTWRQYVCPEQLEQQSSDLSYQLLTCLQVIYIRLLAGFPSVSGKKSPSFLKHTSKQTCPVTKQK